MVKIKKFFKKKYPLCLICALFSFLVISTTFNNNNKIVKGANTIIEEDFVYLLPQVVTKTTTSSSSILPSMLFGINSDGTPFLYTMTGSNPANNLRYVRRNFTPTSNSNGRFFEYTYSPYLLFGGYSATIFSSVFAGSQTAKITYSSNLVGTTVLPVFTEGTIVVVNDKIGYELSNVDSDGHTINSIFFDITIDIASSNTYNFQTSFYPTLISLSATGGASLNEAYEAGRRVGYDEGEAVGYQNGINDSNTFTFSNLISAVIDVPINSFKSLLNFNFLDINLLDFALSIITLFVVIKIVGVINGKA